MEEDVRRLRLARAGEGVAATAMSQPAARRPLQPRLARHRQRPESSLLLGHLQLAFQRRNADQARVT